MSGFASNANRPLSEEGSAGEASAAYPYLRGRQSPFADPRKPSMSTEEAQAEARRLLDLRKDGAGNGDVI